MTDLSIRLTQTDILGHDAILHPEYTSVEVTERFLEKLQPFLAVIDLKEEEIDGFVDAFGDPITGPVPIVDQLARLLQDGLKDDIENSLADLLDLASNGYDNGTKTSYLTTAMGNALQELFQSLESVGIQVDDPSTLTPDKLVAWKNLQGVSDIFTDIAQKLERAALTGPHSLQALVELVYVKTGNEVMAEAMERLEEALATTKKVLNTLTDVQSLHNKIDVEANIPQVFDSARSLLTPESPDYVLTVSNLISGDISDNDKEIVLSHIQSVYTELAEKFLNGTATSEEITGLQRFSNTLKAYLTVGVLGLTENPPNSTPPLPNFDASQSVAFSTIQFWPDRSNSDVSIGDPNSHTYELSTFMQDYINANLGSLDSGPAINLHLISNVGNPTTSVPNFLEILNNMSFEDLQATALLSTVPTTSSLINIPVNPNNNSFPNGTGAYYGTAPTDQFNMRSGYNLPTPTQWGAYLRDGVQFSYSSFVQQLEDTFGQPVNPAPNFTQDDVVAFERLRDEINEQIITLEAVTPTTPEGTVDQESLLAKLQTLQSDIEAAFDASADAESALFLWIMDSYSDTDSESAGLIQRNITNAIVAAQSLNDSQKSEVRRFLFVFEEYYKSSAAILQKITQLIERIAQGISR